MSYILVVLLSISGGILAAEHFHSFLVGFFVAATATGASYWLSFRHSKYPQLAFLFLLVGLMAKMAVTVAGVMWSLERDLITSPFVFSLSYLFFTIVCSYCYFKFREFSQGKISDIRQKLMASS
ncbi:NADH:ubiquinone oxidoreductase [Veronia pacifica]|uniref:NADH:ubiquinone oxidoreductase n=1 Tax=Veronia pacifica TaxID=1080227 RepID=A0A1C3EQW5_9GAMM|nr:NADH:ubiquinone oxidoreductase [Veronia pacifica]ODA35633.1 NADH:ubiquinone oxidoreductase [Veronia pacifica]